MVIFGPSLYYLPQHLATFAPGVLANRSLALLGVSSLGPTDPVRREVYRQLAANIVATSLDVMAGWPRPLLSLSHLLQLERGTEESISRVVPSKTKGKHKRSLWPVV